MSDHTPEPWRQERASKSLHPRSYERVITDADYEYIIAELFQFGEEDPREANARRIVACVNACKGIPTELLEHPYANGALTEAVTLWQQVADLRAALGSIRRRNHEMHHFLPEPCPDALCAEYDRILAATQPQEVQA